SEGRADESSVRHVDRGRGGPDRGGGPHELHADGLVVDQSVTGGLRPRKSVARNAVGGCGVLQVGVRPVDLPELPEGTSSRGARGRRGVSDATAVSSRGPGTG